MTLAVETKSGTKKFTMNWSDLEDNFTVSVEGMPVRLMPQYVENAVNGKRADLATLPQNLTSRFVSLWRFREPDLRAG